MRRELFRFRCRDQETFARFARAIRSVSVPRVAGNPAAHGTRERTHETAEIRGQRARIGLVSQGARGVAPLSPLPSPRSQAQTPSRTRSRASSSRPPARAPPTRSRTRARASKTPSVFSSYAGASRACGIANRRLATLSELISLRQEKDAAVHASDIECSSTWDAGSQTLWCVAQAADGTASITGSSLSGSQLNTAKAMFRCVGPQH